MNAPAQIQFDFPTTQQRVFVAGRTGSGKTQFGAWMLSEAPFDRMPYVIVDYKGEDLFASTSRIQEIGFNEVPKHPGVYKLSPIPEVDDANVNNWLWKAWQRENVGLFVDEGYRMPRASAAFNAFLTQGRSKYLPVITLTQRPSWISQFVYSEADYFSIFQLSKKEDRKRIQDFIPPERVDVEIELPDYHCHWYSVAKRKAFIMLPVPDAAVIAETLHSRLKPKRRIL